MGGERGNTCTYYKRVQSGLSELTPTKENEMEVKRERISHLRLAECVLMTAAGTGRVY
jgi:hypothetical protein